MTDLSLSLIRPFLHCIEIAFKKLNRQFILKGTVKKKRKCLFFFICKCKTKVKYRPGKKKKEEKRKVSHICIVESFKGHLTWKYF